MTQYGFFYIFVLSPHASAMSRIFVLDLGRGSLVTNTGGGSRGGARGSGPYPFIFRPKGGLKTKKKLTGPPPPYLRVWMTAPPPLSEGLDPPLNT